MKPVTKKSFRASQLITFMNYTVGGCDIDLDAEVIIPDSLKGKFTEGKTTRTYLNWFLDGRSKLRHLQPALKQWCLNKPDLINFFINSSRSIRASLIETNPGMFFILPGDLKNLDLHSFRELGTFSPVAWYSFEMGGTVNYPVFGMREVLSVYNEVILGVPKPELGSLVLGNQSVNKPRAFDAVLGVHPVEGTRWK